MVRKILAFVMAVVIATVGMSLISSHNVIANLAAMGYPLAPGEQVSMYLTDLMGFAPLTSIVNAGGLLIAFLVAWGVIRYLWNAPSIGYPLAGGVALWAEIQAMAFVYGTMPIAGARTLEGVVAMIAVGLLSGLVYWRIISQQKSG